MGDQCRSCQAEVIFVPSAKTGKPMILDAKPEKRVVLTLKRGATVLADGMHRDANATVVDAYVDHHATCPASAAWRGRHR